MQPQSPNPNFDFMLKDQAKTGGGLPIPNMPKPAKIALAAIVGLVLIVIIASLLSGGGKSQAYTSVLARGSETLRVTAVAQQLNLQDPQTQATAATVNAALSSDKQQISSYLASNHIKVSAAQVAADTDKSTDASLQTAAQNNGLDAAYVNYLKGVLAKYESDLDSAYKGSGPNGKKILANSIESVRTLLNSPPLKS